MLGILSPIIRKTSIRSIINPISTGYGSVLRSFSSVVENGFIVMYKKQGQTIDDMRQQLEQKMGIHSLIMVEDLEPSFNGLVTFACGKSKRLLPFIDHLNCYSITLSSETSIPRRDFVKAMANYIGESRQKRLVQLDDSDPDSYVIYSTPIKINDILIKKYTQTPTTTMDLSLRCDTGCDVATLINDIEQTIKRNTKNEVSMRIDHCSRIQHCGVKESSPMCIDSEDIDGIEYVHSSISPWFIINNVTMLQHLSIAYFNDMRLFVELKKNRQIESTSTDISYFEHWSEESLIPMKPVNGLPVMLITPPKKTARPIKQGRKFKTENQPSMMVGIGKLIQEMDNRFYIKPEVLVPPTPASLMNIESIKSSQYFHRARKPKI